jgi:hypothetical protein
MALKFTRKNYDNSIMEQNDAQSFNVNNYMLNVNAHENTNFCYTDSEIRNSNSQVSRPINNGVMDLGAKVDIETKLQNRHVELNSIERLNEDYLKTNVSVPPTCVQEENNGYNDTRFSEPIENYREMNTLEYKFSPYLPVNPQNVVVENDGWMFGINRGGVSSRYYSRLENRKGTSFGGFGNMLPK